MMTKDKEFDSGTFGVLIQCVFRRGMLTIACLILGACMDANSSDSMIWKEEVVLHDGRKVIVSRIIERGGQHEVGQPSPIKYQSMKFTLPDTSQVIDWKDSFSEDIGGANFLPMSVDIVEGNPYIVAYPMGCQSYNKWGRPNPPYVVFLYKSTEWIQIPFQELPSVVSKINLIFSSPDIEVEKTGKNFISADMIREITRRYKQPEFQSIVREPLASEKINQMCMDMIFYKGYWIMPNDPVARALVDRKTK